MSNHRERIIEPLFKLLDENYKATAKHMTVELTVDERVFIDLRMEIDARYIETPQQGEWLLIDRGTREDIVIRKLRDAALRYPLSLQPLVGTERRNIALTNALRDALNLAARVMEELDEAGGRSAYELLSKAGDDLARLQKVLEEK